jgi:hypothetical protein
VQAAAAIERTGRETLLEMRRLLGVMHGDEAPAELEPSPTLADLANLCSRVGASLIIQGEPQPIGMGLQMGAYRVVQEALAEAGRAVPGSTPVVTLEWSPTSLTLLISDDRPYGAPPPVGVVERVGLYDGQVRTGVRAGGDGHELNVRFPIHHDTVVPQGAP